MNLNLFLLKLIQLAYQGPFTITDLLMILIHLIILNFLQLILQFDHSSDETQLRGLFSLLLIHRFDLINFFIRSQHLFISNKALFLIYHLRFPFLKAILKVILFLLTILQHVYFTLLSNLLFDLTMSKDLSIYSPCLCTLHLSYRFLFVYFQDPFKIKLIHL